MLTVYIVLGHGSKKCPEERQEVEKTVISCANCNEEGHRARDCLQARKEPRGPRACKNCGSTEHIAKECPEPPNPENVECRNCGESMSPPLLLASLGMSANFLVL
jgi:hypothetical protein